MIEPYYKQDGIEIYNADCRDVLPQLETFDLLLTDPPYGIGADNRKQILSRGKLAKPRDYGESNWDTKPADKGLITTIIKHSTDSIIWGGNYFELIPSSCWFVWDKDNGSNDFADCELAWTNFKKAVRKFKWRWNGMIQERGGDKKENRVHPTQKPLPLMQWCIKQAGDGINTIFDPFMGSGTTLVAAKLEGKQAVGIELDESYCESAAKRLEQGVLFAAEV
jgi:DNA modification methylase